MLIETTSPEFLQFITPLLDEVRKTTIIQCKKELNEQEGWIGRDEAMNKLSIKSRQNLSRIPVKRKKVLGKWVYNLSSINKYLNS